MKSEFLKNWDTQMKKGVLPLFVLQALQQQERYGYELIQELKTSFGLEVTEGTIYPLLIRLAKENLVAHKWVEQASGIPRKYYTISEDGKQAYQEMKKITSSTFKKVK